MIESIYWTSILIIFYTYIGYWIVLRCLNLFKEKEQFKASIDGTASVAIVIPSWNESAFLKEKLANTADLNYPIDKLHIVVITDGSTDGSEKFLHALSSRHTHKVSVLHKPQRSGKAHAMNRSIDFIKSQSIDVEYVVFTDANCFLNNSAIINLLQAFNDPAVALVSGQKKIVESTGRVGAEQIYWSMESQIKTEESRFNTVIGAVGELFMIKLASYPNPDTTCIVEDFYISMKLALSNQKTAFAANAIATESDSMSLADEYERKSRITAGGFQTFRMLPSLLAFWRHPKLFFQVVSHRLFRWLFSPIAFFSLLIANALLVVNNPSSFYYISMVAIVLALVFSIANHLFKGLRISILNAPLYFAMTQLAQLSGLYRFLTNTQSSLWKKVGR